ncbi:MAG: GNAT family N-acetyltransferase [Ruminiclostridium sp.]|nr:GNAT family N-acetyltransferase [Ruminiclostridium sp.]MBQ8410594.1 GNAT family N-acetyltransferase [Ruminiclostridium sp.]MBQ8841328.1 GNAT family N-acetyltransferase [Ruminiclostridium sp.]
MTEIKKNLGEDCAEAYRMTRELMAHHNALDIFTMTEERFCQLVNCGMLYSFSAYYDGAPAGVMNFFFKLTTFTGKKILYIEDLYVREQFRGKGLGKEFISAAREIASLQDCEQIELKCADWNKSSAEFYKSIGMKDENEWITFTLPKSLF